MPGNYRCRPDMQGREETALIRADKGPTVKITENGGNER
jgi:hypothetical protein